MDDRVDELPVSFLCEGLRLHGILHRPQRASPRAVLLIVGGPQYRVGSHRQFVLLARALAARGSAVLRFDYRGMGDSEGDTRSFEAINADARAAIDALMAAIPQAREVVIWGLCDAASAALFYASSDPRVRGLVLVNPWAREAAGLARAYLRHYYLRRLVDAQAWRQLFSGRGRLQRAIGSVAQTVRAALGTGSAHEADSASVSAPATPSRRPLIERMADGATRFAGPVLLIISGDDITAAEFKAAAQGSRRWRKVLRRRDVTQRHLEAADHTFSRREWRDQVAEWTQAWLGTW